MTDERFAAARQTGELVMTPRQTRLAKNYAATHDIDPRIAESIVTGSPVAALAADNPMFFADQFISTMKHGVIDNERCNMCNDNPDVIVAGWDDAKAIIDVYDDYPDVDESKFPQFSAEEQQYITAELDRWLAAKKRSET